jgi:hypothetical protein
MKRRPSGKFKVARESIMQRRAESLTLHRELALHLFKFRHVPVDDPSIRSKIDFRPFYKEIKERAFRDAIPYSEIHGETYEFQITDEFEGDLENGISQYEYDYEYEEEEEDREKDRETNKVVDIEEDQSDSDDDEDSDDEMEEKGGDKISEYDDHDDDYDDSDDGYDDELHLKVRNAKVTSSETEGGGGGGGGSASTSTISNPSKVRKRVKRRKELVVEEEEDDNQDESRKKIPWMFRLDYEYIPEEDYEDEEEEVPT